MSEKIKIGVDATLNAAGLERDAKRIDKTLQDVGKRKIDPVAPDAVKKVDALFQAYLKIDREMARRLKVTNQQGLGPDQIDWKPVYQNDKSRQAKLAQLQSFMRHGGEDFAPPVQGGGGGGGGFKDGVKGAAVGAAQAGMRATGPVGGVAANALGTGMSSGFGAGLMGLFGGIAALGVGKLVGSIAEKIDQAENNNIAYDRLKRTLGDVNVSFEGLKSAVMLTGEGLNITYDESSALASKFAKLGNVSGAAYRDLPGELGVGVGLSKAYGLDNEQGVGFMGQLRGVGVTKDTQDSRRMAILIGETIAKAGAFAKADEVLDAIAGFATSQTRASMSVANVSGYAGMLSSMVGSGIPGMDVQGSSAILSRMNSALSAGGARGEASQFFTSMVGNRMGLDPLQTQVLREGGMFASKDQMFGMAENGKPSAYQRYMGQTGPTGSSTFLEETRKLIEEKYAGDSETQKLMRAQAFGNHTGLNMNQSMAVLSMQPNQMGEMQKYAGDMSKLSASGIANMGTALFGTGADRQQLATNMLGREDVSAADKDRIKQVMSTGSQQEQKEVLAKLSAQYEQEKTMGTDIRDSRAALDNIKTKIADYAVPALLDMRKALLYMAGAKDGKTPGQVMDEIAKGESKDRIRGLEKTRDTKRAALDAEDDKLKNEQQGLNTMMTSGTISREEYGKQWKAAQERRNEISKERDQNDAEYESGVKSEKEGRIRPTGAPIGNPGSINQSMKFFMDKGWTKEQAAGITANLMKESNMRPGAVGDGGQAYGIAQWHPDRQRDFERWSGKSIKDSTVQEQLEFVHYEMTQGKEKAAGDRLRATKTADDAGAAVSKYYERPEKREAEARERGANAERIFNSQGTPMPADAKINPGRGSAESYNQLRVSAEPMSITVNHKDQWGREVRAPETIQTRINAPDPNTYNHR